MGRRGHMRDDSVEILFRGFLLLLLFLREAIVSSSDFDVCQPDWTIINSSGQGLNYEPI